MSDTFARRDVLQQGRASRRSHAIWHCNAPGFSYSSGGGPWAGRAAHRITAQESPNTGSAGDAEARRASDALLPPRALGTGEYLADIVAGENEGLWGAQCHERLWHRAGVARRAIDDGCLHFLCSQYMATRTHGGSTGTHFHRQEVCIRARSFEDGLDGVGPLTNTRDPCHGAYLRRFIRPGPTSTSNSEHPPMPNSSPQPHPLFALFAPSPPVHTRTGLFCAHFDRAYICILCDKRRPSWFEHVLAYLRLPPPPVSPSPVIIY